MRSSLALRKTERNSATRIYFTSVWRFNNHMADIDEIRRANIRALEAEAGGPAAFAKRLEMSDSQYTNLRDGAKDSRTGKQRGMRKETAQRFERCMGKPAGWLDTNHGFASYDLPPGIIPLNAAQKSAEYEAVKKIAAIAAGMSVEGRAVLLYEAGKIAEQFPAVKAKPAS